jgi:hypothetical protein
LPEGQAVALFVQADISTRQGADRVAEQVLQSFGTERSDRGESRSDRQHVVLSILYEHKPTRDPT